jgi:hypothetical protein
MKISFLLLLLSLNGFAQSHLSYSYEEEAIKDRDGDTLEDFEERALHNEAVLSDYNSSLGINTDPYFTGKDESLLSVAYMLSSNYEAPTEHLSFSATYLNRVTSYDDYWWGVQFMQVAGSYESMASPLDSAITQRTTSTQTFSIFGIGLSHRFKLASTIWDNPKVFEEIRAFANYIAHKDSATESTYNGYGLTTDYLLSYRLDKGYFFAGKFSYNIAAVSYPEQTASLDRDLVFGWLSVGVELGLVFQ